MTAAAEPPKVVVLDDGERVSRDDSAPLPPAAWVGDVQLVASGEETVAFQVVVEAGAVARRDLDVVLVLPGMTTRLFAERFIEVRRPTSNDRSRETLAMLPGAEPAAPRTGWLADPLVPLRAGYTLEAPAHGRAAVWIDVAVPRDAPAGEVRSTLTVRAAGTEIATRTVVLRVLPGNLPYPGGEAMVFYEPATLRRRMGDAPEIERSLRHLLHAHRLSAIRDVRSVDDLTREDDALTGEVYTAARGYDGPGQGIGERVVAFGAYGTLGEPDPTNVTEVAAMVQHGRERGWLATTSAFVYAIDEDCSSTRAARWLTLLHERPLASDLRVGVTCGKDPHGQDADLVMMTSPDYDPAAAKRAISAGKAVWVYNGQRPFAGAMMLELPATDLRANAWIAARYAIPRWFYWESTFWMDNNRGGQGGSEGHDPLVVAETFHNGSGDRANGDGVLVYPGTQRPPMTDLGRAEVLPSVRLKNLRRGLADRAYIEIARGVDAGRTEAIVQRMVPHALGQARRGERPAWPERGAAWAEARAALLDVIERRPPGPLEQRPLPALQPATAEQLRRKVIVWVAGAAVLVLVLVLGLRAQSRSA